MKRLINRKCVAMALAILIALSSFSIIGATAVTTNDTTVGASTDVVDSNASIEQQQSNAKAHKPNKRRKGNLTWRLSI